MSANEIDLDTELSTNISSLEFPGTFCRPAGGIVSVKPLVSLPDANIHPDKLIPCPTNVLQNKISIPGGRKVAFRLNLPIKNGRNGQDSIQVSAVRPISEEECNELRQRFDPLEKTIQAVKDFEKKLRSKQQEFVKKEASLDVQIEQKANDRFDKMKISLDIREKEIEQKQKKVDTDIVAAFQMQEDAQKEEQQLRELQHWFQEKGGERILPVLEKLKVDEEKEGERNWLPSVMPKGEPTQEIRKSLANSGYQATDIIVRQTLLSLCVAAITGQFVVLTGPPGSGKTSLTAKLADQLGAGYGCVPVRPAWIDPTDLLGFYDPQRERFQPAPFLDKVLEAKRDTALNRLYFLVLDEMNLGRVENYAADFMAQMEKSKQYDTKLSLYSQDIYRRLAAKSNALCDKMKAGTTEETISDHCLLREHLVKYPATLSIPKGLVLFGTINMDETTHSLSPKFLDRALVVQIADCPLPKKLMEQLAEEEIRKMWRLSLGTAWELADVSAPIAEVDAVWKDITNWNEKYFLPLGLRLSHRTTGIFRIYVKCAYGLQMTNIYEITSLFLMSKLLPGISFNEDAQADMGKKSKKELLKDWIGELGKYKTLKEAVSILSESSSPIIQYLR